MISWIPEGHVAIIESFGKFSHVQEPGFYTYIPGIYTTKYLYNWKDVANKNGYLIETSEQQSNTATRLCQTKDNIILRANTSIGWKIIDPKKAVYATDHLPTMISDLALNSLRSNIGTLTLNEIFSSREKLNTAISLELSEITSKWGVELIRVEIQELTYTDEVASAMMREMIAEKEKKAKITTSEGDALATLSKAKAAAESVEIQAKAYARAKIIEAEAEATASALKAKAERNYLLELKQEVSQDQAATILEADKNRASLEKITENSAHKVFLPAQSQTMIHV